ncbi:MAG: hypothetical protein J6Y39_07050 [Bacteroidaceae bacterium]|nr:hypothetical protein [Bacteroidaceae bacterium]
MKKRTLWRMVCGVWAVFLLAFAACDDNIANENDKGDPDAPNAELVRNYLLGIWEVTSCTENSVLGVNFILNEDGTGQFAGTAFTYNILAQEDGSVQANFYQGGSLMGQGDVLLFDREDGGHTFEFHFDIYQVGLHFASGTVALGSKGNVLTGEFRMEGNMMPSKITLKKQGYTYPEEGVFGRWQMTSCGLNPRRVGEILVVEDNSELYIEGSPSIYSYTLSNVEIEGETVQRMDILLEGRHFTGILHLEGGTMATYSFNVEDDYNDYTATFVRCW